METGIYCLGRGATKSVNQHRWEPFAERWDAQIFLDKFVQAGDLIDAFMRRADQLARETGV